jgi:hypothetical protein
MGEMFTITAFKFRRPDLSEDTLQKLSNADVTDLNQQAYPQAEEDFRSFLDDSTKRVELR